MSDKKKTWVLIERVGDGPKLNGHYNTWLAEWPNWDDVVGVALEELEAGKPYDLMFTILEMTDAEYVEYCRENEIDVTVESENWRHEEGRHEER